MWNRYICAFSRRAHSRIAKGFVGRIGPHPCAVLRIIILKASCVDPICRIRINICIEIQAGDLPEEVAVQPSSRGTVLRSCGGEVKPTARMSEQPSILVIRGRASVACCHGSIGRVIVALHQIAGAGVNHVPDASELIRHIHQLLPGADDIFALLQIAPQHGIASRRGSGRCGSHTTSTLWS